MSKKGITINNKHNISLYSFNFVCSLTLFSHLPTDYNASSIFPSCFLDALRDVISFWRSKINIHLWITWGSALIDSSRIRVFPYIISKTRHGHNLILQTQKWCALERQVIFIDLLIDFRFILVPLLTPEVYAFRELLCSALFGNVVLYSGKKHKKVFENILLCDAVQRFLFAYIAFDWQRAGDIPPSPSGSEVFNHS